MKAVLCLVLALACSAAAAQVLPQDIAATEFAAADKRLNTNYKAAMERLDAAKKATLRTAQRAWIKERDAKCAPDPDEGIGPGSMGELNAKGCATAMTSARAAELRDLK